MNLTTCVSTTTVIFILRIIIVLVHFVYYIVVIQSIVDNSDITNYFFTFDPSRRESYTDCWCVYESAVHCACHDMRVPMTVSW